MSLRRGRKPDGTHGENMGTRDEVTHTLSVIEMSNVLLAIITQRK